MENYKLKKKIIVLLNDYTTKIKAIYWVKQPNTKKFWLKILIKLYI